MTLRGTEGIEVDVEACVALASRLIEIPSLSGEEHDVAVHLAEYLDTLSHVEVEVIEPANVLATLHAEEHGPRRLFLTHTDTMAPGAMERPFDAAQLDGAGFGKSGTVLRGLGAAAPKGAVAAMVVALAALSTSRDAWKGSVQLAAVTKDLMSDHAGVKEVAAVRALVADWALAGEPSGNKLFLGSRGIAHVRVTLDGVPAHCGRPADAVNPLFGLADLLGAVRDADLPMRPDMGEATLVPFRVESEASPPQSPSQASVMLDRRTLPSEDTASVVEEIAAMAQAAAARTDGLTIDVAPVRAMHPFSISADAPLVRAARGAIRSATGHEPETVLSTFASNAGYTTRELGIPSIAYGPGEITDLGPNEHVTVEQLSEAAQAYAALMMMEFPAD